MATRDYTLGKGKVTFLKDNTASLAVLAAGGFTDLGNAPAMAVSLATEKLEHQSSRDGIGLVDMSVVTKTTATGSFTLDEPNSNNLAMFFMDENAAAGTASPVTTQTVYDDIFTAINVWYPITLVSGGTLANGAVTASANNQGSGTTATLTGTQTSPNATSGQTYVVRVKAEGASGAATVVCRQSGGAWSATPITITDATPFNVTVGAGDTDTGLNLTFGTITTGTLQEGDEFYFSTSYTGNTGARVTDITEFVCDSKVAGTDYTLDAAAGLVMFLTTPGVITTCTVTGQINNKDVIEGFSTSQMKGWIYYVANPAAGIPVDVVGYCRVSPTGDLALIGTDWTQMQFTVDFLKVEGFPIVKIETREKV